MLLAQEKLDKVLEALYTSQTGVLGLDATAIAATAQTDAISEILIRHGLCTSADFINRVAVKLTERMEEMVDAGILDEDALAFLTADEDDALGEV